MATRRILLMLALSTGACASSDPSPAAGDARVTDAPAADAPAADRAPAVDAASDASAGAPVPDERTPTHRIALNAGVEGVATGAMAGCAVTAATGGSFRLVCGGLAADRPLARVEGSIWTHGAVSGVVPGCADSQCALEAGDRVSAPVAVPGGQRVDFSWAVSRDVDGVDFVVSEEPVYFSILMDGRPDPARVFFPSQDLGGAPATASADPFGLTGQ
ncbi:MAG: hypothetical protein U0324_02080 [Polyangiales bacterium]